MDKLHFETPNITEQNVDRIAELFPGVITERRDGNGKLTRAVNFELLKQHLSPDVLAGDEAYEFTWVGKKASIVEANRPIRKTLRPCKDESKDWDTTENLYIEGDNLDVLKLLQESYLGKVKMIYIDPPYNTGHDFIYNDRFEMDEEEYNQQIGLFDEEENRNFRENNESNPRFHSDWCSMMYARLNLALRLLTDDGVLFISIDDNEVENLKKCTNEVFGESNFVADMIWNTEGHTDNQYDIKINHEYICIYAKDIKQLELGWVIDPNTRDESNLWKGFAENSITKNGPANPPSVIKLKAGFPCKVNDLYIKSNNPSSDFWNEVQKNGYITRQVTEKYNLSYPIRLNDMKVLNGALSEDVELYTGWGNANKLKQFIDNRYTPIEESDGKVSFFFK